MPTNPAWSMSRVLLGLLSKSAGVLNPSAPSKVHLGPLAVHSLGSHVLCSFMTLSVHYFTLIKKIVV